MGATITATRGVPTVPGEIRWFPMAASQTFKRGQFCYLNESGLLAVCGSDPGGIAGMAECDATEASGGEAVTLNVACPITLAKRGQQFTLNVSNGASTLATSNVQVGHQAEMYVASNICYCDYGNQSNLRLVVDDIAPDNTVGDTSGRLICEVIGDYAQLAQGTS